MSNFILFLFVLATVGPSTPTTKVIFAVRPRHRRTVAKEAAAAKEEAAAAEAAVWVQHTASK